MPVVGYSIRKLVHTLRGDLIRMDGEEDDPTLALHDLYLVLVYGHGGGVGSADEIARALRSAGFSKLRQIPLEGLFSVITAEKQSLPQCLENHI